MEEVRIKIKNAWTHYYLVKRCCDLICLDYFECEKDASTSPYSAIFRFENPVDMYHFTMLFEIWDDE